MTEPHRLPPLAQWDQLGIEIGAELHAGKQSRVFVATIDGRRVAIKLTDAQLADRTRLAERMRMVEALAGRTDVAVRPRRLDGELVQRIGAWLLTATPLVEGDQLDVDDADDARLMGRALADLHRSLAELPGFAVPPVAALDLPDADRPAQWQLLHGDFSDQNILSAPAGIRVFDFDDAGYGPVAYDVANSLYMVLFDADVTGRPERSDTFRTPFVEGYNERAATAVDDAAIDAMIAVRVRALRRWLDDLPNAPIGIRTSSPEWLGTLRAFVASRTTER